jgi:hypothetical protein
MPSVMPDESWSCSSKTSRWSFGLNPLQRRFHSLAHQKDPEQAQHSHETNRVRD